MDQNTLTTVLVALVSGLVLAFAVVLWWGVKRWVSHTDSLQEAITDLRNSIAALRSQFVDKEDYRRDLGLLRQLGIGRRREDVCPLPDCPLAKDFEDVHKE